MKYLAIPFIMLAAGSAFANQVVQKQVEVIANIPTDTFYVEQDGTWMGQPQELTYNVVTGALAPVNKRLIAKSTSGAITARLDHAAVINSGVDSIALDVTVNSVKLNTVATEVVPEADKGLEVFMPITIAAAAAPTGGYLPGNYAGIVSMTFETPLTTP